MSAITDPVALATLVRALWSYEGWPICENAINGALRRLGYSGDEMTSHGFRASASTLLNESRLWSGEAIEAELAHADQNAIRRIYNRATYWEERVRKTEWWSKQIGRALSSDRSLAKSAMHGQPRSYIQGDTASARAPAPCRHARD